MTEWIQSCIAGGKSGAICTNQSCNTCQSHCAKCYNFGSDSCVKRSGNCTQCKIKALLILW